MPQYNGQNFSEHFTLAECEHSDKAEELGIDNTLPSIYYGNAMNLAKYILEPIRLHFGEEFSPLSWYRCPKLNEAVGGAKNSDHMVAGAADIRLQKVSLMALAEYIRDNLLFDQVILEKLWIHCGFRKDANRKEVLRNEDGKYLIGLS